MKEKIQFRINRLRENLDVFNKNGFDIDSFLVIDTMARIDELESLLECVKYTDKDIQDFIDKWGKELNSLANDIMCPKCKKLVREPLFNLGEQYGSFEGCETCYKEIQKEQK